MILSRLWFWIKGFGSEKYFFQRTQKLSYILGFFALNLTIVGLILGLAIAPMDYQQGNSYRIIYIHVPSSFIAQFVYIFIAVNFICAWIWKIKVYTTMARVSIVFGMLSCLLSLFTGAIWGKPTWGTYWVWDARLTSMLILLFLYAGLFLVENMNANSAKKTLLLTIISVLGLINIPIIKYSVEWWFTLHQGATLTLTKNPSMDSSMLIPLLIMLLANYLFFGWYVLKRTHSKIIKSHMHSRWFQAYINKNY